MLLSSLLLLLLPFFPIDPNSDSLGLTLKVDGGCPGRCRPVRDVQCLGGASVVPRCIGEISLSWRKKR